MSNPDCEALLIFLKLRVVDDQILEKIKSHLRAGCGNCRITFIVAKERIALLDFALKNKREFFTTGEIARHSAVTNDAVIKWIKSGKLKAFSTPGGHHRVRAEDFRAFLTQYDIPFEESIFYYEINDKIRAHEEVESSRRN